MSASRASVQREGTRHPDPHEIHAPGTAAHELSTRHLWVWLWLDVSLRLWCLVCVLVVVTLGVVESGVAL